MSSIAELWHLLPGYHIDHSISESGPTPGITVDGTMALIPIVGPTSKYGQHGTSSTVHVRSLVRQAAESPAIDRAMVYFDTPGGQVAGNMELANDVLALASIKPTFAFGSDLLASAGYEVASQAGRIFTNDSALVGSIGTMAMLYDTSKMFESMGVKAHSLATGEHKGVGAMGVPITDAQVAARRELITKVNEQFIQAVSTGRNMTKAQAKQLADGRVHIASDAMELGLIDRVATLEQSIEELRHYSPSTKVFSMYPQNGAGTAATLIPQSTSTFTSGGLQPAAQIPQQQPVPPPPALSAPVNAVEPATIEEIEAACPGVSAEFVLAQFKAKATVQSAQTAYIQHVTQENAALKLGNLPAQAPVQPVAEVQPVAPQQQAAAPILPVQMPGNTSLAPAAPEHEWLHDPVGFWNQEVARRRDMYVASGKMLHEAQTMACSETIRAFPGLADAFNSAMGVSPRAK